MLCLIQREWCTAGGGQGWCCGEGRHPVSQRLQQAGTGVKVGRRLALGRVTAQQRAGALQVAAVGGGGVGPSQGAGAGGVGSALSVPRGLPWQQCGARGRGRPEADGVTQVPGPGGHGRRGRRSDSWAFSPRPVRNLELLSRQHPPHGPQDGRDCGPRGRICDGFLPGRWAPEDLQGGGASGHTWCSPNLSVLSGSLPLTKEKHQHPAWHSGSGVPSLGSAPHLFWDLTGALFFPGPCLPTF